MVFCRQSVLVCYPTVRFRQPAGHVERRGPHILEKLPQPGQALGTGTVEAAGSHPAFRDKAGVAQHGEVLAYGGPCHVERGRYLAGRELVVRDQSQDGAATGFGDRVERLVQPYDDSVPIKS
jgi:hypothetical protein